MGNCVNPRRLDDFNSDIMHVEWSFESRYQGKERNEMSVGYTNFCCSKNFMESPNWHKGVALDDFLRGRSKEHILAEAGISRRKMAEFGSQSVHYLGNITSEVSGHLSSPSYLGSPSPSPESADYEKFFSFDGLNERIVNRYDIGLRMLKAQIHHGSDPNVLTTHGERSCLMFAVLAEDFCFIKKLIELGVDVNQTNPLGETALSLANELQRDDIATYLRMKGAVELVN